jgi:hypothetical protein
VPDDRFGLPVTTSSGQALGIDPEFALAHIALARNAQLYDRMAEARAASARGHAIAVATASNGRG